MSIYLTMLHHKFHLLSIFLHKKKRLFLNRLVSSIFSFIQLDKLGLYFYPSLIHFWPYIKFTIQQFLIFSYKYFCSFSIIFSYIIISFFVQKNVIYLFMLYLFQLYMLKNFIYSFVSLFFILATILATSDLRQLFLYMEETIKGIMKTGKHTITPTRATPR